MSAPELTRENELQAMQSVVYASLRRIHKWMASADRLKKDSPEEVLAAIREEAKGALDAVDALTQAEMKRGMSLADEDVLDTCDAFGYAALSDKGKLQVLAALKRKALHERAQQQELGVVGSIAP